MRRSFSLSHLGDVESSEDVDTRVLHRTDMRFLHPLIAILVAASQVHSNLVCSMGKNQPVGRAVTAGVSL